MAARTGMADIILRLRSMVNAGTADYTVNDVSYWTDNQLQDVLDQHVQFIEDKQLKWLAETIEGGSVVYHRAAVGYYDLEGTASGTIYWNIKTGPGSIVALAGYTPDYLTGQIRFTNDQAGSAYYITCRSYDLNAAAADVWMQKGSHYVEWYRFSADAQSFDRQQAYEHARDMAALYRSRVGQNRDRSGLQFTRIQRTDLSGSE